MRWKKAAPEAQAAESIEPPKLEYPSVPQLEAELKKERHRVRYSYALKTTVYMLLAAAAAAVLVAMLWLPVLQIYGSSMTPTLNEGEIVLSVKTKTFETGDVVAFYHNNKVLIKRIISGPGSWVDIDEDGVVYVDEVPIEEPYLTETALGECDIRLPYQVPDGRYFVMGDHRSTSVDSRSSTVGCVSKDQIVGKIIFRVWPLSAFGRIG